MPELIGKIIKFLPVKSGTGKNGEWTNQEFLIETQDKYPKEVVFSDFNDRANARGFAEGTMVKVAFDASSRQYNERYYTELRAYSIQPHGDSASPKQPVAGSSTRNTSPARQQPTEVSSAFLSEGNDDDLPF